MKRAIVQNLETDEKLFEDFKQDNSQEAFKELYKRYHRKVYSYCLRACSNKDEAQDVFQMVWANVVEWRQTFKGGCFVAWLMTITRNFCIQQKRKQKNFDEIYENTLTTNELSKNDFLLSESIREQIAKLSDDFREIIELYYFDDFSYEQISEMLEISMSLVKVRLFRAKKQLVQLLSPFRSSLNEL